MLASCGGGKYKVAVTFPDDSFNGKVAYLTSYDTGDTIDSVSVANKCAMLSGNVDGSYYARLMVDGSRLGLIVGRRRHCRAVERPQGHRHRTQRQAE